MATELTPALAKGLLETAALGVLKATVCDFCGVSEPWLDEVIRIGLGGNAPDGYADFAKRFLKTEAGLEVDVMKAIKLAIQVDPMVGFEFLARRFPKRWGKNATQTGTAADLRPTALEEADQNAMLAEILAKRPPRLVALLKQAGFDERPGYRPEPAPSSQLAQLPPAAESLAQPAHKPGPPRKKPTG